MCLEVAIGLKDTEYLRISMGIISTIRIILQASIRAQPHLREDVVNWEQVRRYTRNVTRFCSSVVSILHLALRFVDTFSCLAVHALRRW